jgi:peptide/nickel transport system ATP-binding protein
MQKVRGNKISMIFQEPMTALNPVLSIRRQLTEPFFIHRGYTKKQAEKAALDMLGEVRIPSAERVLKGYPHQLSGGMRQRVMIAMALACRPKLLIADEPTTALDVTVQAQILRLMRSLQKERNAAVLLITHDLGVVNENADNVAVLYCGQVVEQAQKTKIFGNGKYSHPYTEGLLFATPSVKRSERLETIAGSVPPPWDLPKGCKFSPRCKYRTEKCLQNEPPLFEMKNGQKIRCFYADKGERKSDEHASLIVR